MARGEPQIKFRFPVEMHEAIAEAANANAHSMNAEIVSRIRRSLVADADRTETLRDKFAMAALAGILASEANDTQPFYHPHTAADRAYWMADAMLAAREPA